MLVKLLVKIKLSYNTTSSHNIYVTLNMKKKKKKKKRCFIE